MGQLDPSRSPNPHTKVIHSIIVDPTCPSVCEDASKLRQLLKTVNWSSPAGRRSPTPAFLILNP